VPEREDRELDARVNTELHVHVLEVRVHCVGRHDQLLGCRAVRHAARHEHGDPDFGAGEGQPLVRPAHAADVNIGQGVTRDGVGRGLRIVGRRQANTNKLQRCEDLCDVTSRTAMLQPYLRNRNRDPRFTRECRFPNTLR